MFINVNLFGLYIHNTILLQQQIKFIMIMDRKDAIEVIKKNWPDNSFTRLREALETLIPELKESEDDRIRKWIIRDIKQALDDNVYNDESIDSAKEALAWLKKQGEQILANSAKTCKDVQKSAWSEEDEEYYNSLIGYLKYSITNSKPETYKSGSFTDWLKSIKDRYTWKPSDEHYELEEFAKIVRGNLTGISKAVQALFENKYLKLTGKKMYGGFKD